MTRLLQLATLALSASIGLLESAGRATPVFNVVAGQCPNNPALCSATNGEVTSTLFNIFLINPLNDTTGAYANLFTPAFNAWNAAQPANRKWTLVPADLSATAQISVTTYQAFVEDGSCDGDPECGGAEIDISYTQGNARDPFALNGNFYPWTGVWAQSVNVFPATDKPAGAQPGNPYLDNNNPADRVRNPPLYPYQEVGSSFFDQPSRDAEASWQGQAFLTKANYRTRTLTVYDGVGWGFNVTVPEPAGVALFGFGLAGLIAYGRRRSLRSRA